MFSKKSTIILLAGVLILCSVAGIIYFISRNHGKDQTSLGYSSPSQETNVGLTQNGESDAEHDPTGTPEPASLSDSIPEPDLPQKGGSNGNISPEPSEPSPNGDETTPAPLRVITVNNAQELVSQIASNTHVRLMPGLYDFSSFDRDFYTFYYNYRGLRNLENVVFEGIGEEQVDFLSGSVYSDVLSISNSKNITLKNLNLGHISPVEGYSCEGGVIYLSECDGITIDDCTMFGCGTIGIYANNVSNLVCTNSTIRDCAEDLVCLVNSRDVLFQDCTFKSRDFEEIMLYEVSNISMVNCSLIGEKTYYPNILFNGKPIISEPIDGREYIVNDLWHEEYKLKNIAVSGKEYYKELEMLHEGLSAEIICFRFGTRDFSLVECVLIYDEPLKDEEILPQIKAARQFMYKNFAYFDEISVTMGHPETGEPWNGSRDDNIVLGNYKDLGKVMNDQRTYLSVAQAEEILRKWMPPIINRSFEVQEESPEVKYNITRIEKNEVYYLFDIHVGPLTYSYVFYVNAFDGTISHGGKSVGRPTQEQVEAVLSALAESRVTVSEDETFWAFTLDETYIETSLINATYILKNVDGKLIAEPYDEWVDY